MPAQQRPPGALSADDLLDLLVEGEVDVKGRMPWSSNATFLVEVTAGERSTHGVYKPARGERPLWDFPVGLGRREVAAWLVSEALGWGLVPTTVFRDGPLGEGSVQRFVEADFSEHYFTLYDDPANHDALRTICAFDLLLNNTDRKSGHCLLGEDGHIWAIDNGLSFSASPKLRTVIWEFAGEPIPPALVDDIAAVADAPPPGLAALMAEREVAAFVKRAKALVRRPVFPEDPSGHHYPWPLV